MSWPSPIPLSATAETGSTWQILRAWPHTTPGDYTFEVRTPGTPGVRGARLRTGIFDSLRARRGRRRATNPLAQLQADVQIGEVQGGSARDIPSKSSNPSGEAPPVAMICLS
jgi:hypothetical protein